MPGPRIDFWYGDEQRFGSPGRAQRWINVLGNVTDHDGLQSVTWALNGGPPRPLGLGCDSHRLARPGDFNAEFAWHEVAEGANDLTVTAVPGRGEPVAARLRLHVDGRRRWPLPYAVDFAAVERLQEVVQVVDGLWRLQADGVRTAEPYYDRVLSVGDDSWTDYEARARLTVHGFTPSAPGPPTYGVTHMGVALRWGGHHLDGLQPSRRWHPLGAQGEFLLGVEDGRCRWRILFDHPRHKPAAYAQRDNELVLGRPCRVRAQVAGLPDDRSRYRFKCWPEDRPEPAAWDVEGFEESDEPSGALCLVPHNADVTIHELGAAPVDPGTA